MEQESQQIARGLRRRDPELLDRLIEQYQHRLLRYLLYLAGNREQAEDLFQETWLRVLERGDLYDGKHAFNTWLFAVARNLFRDSLRRKQALSLDQPASDGGQPSETFASGQPSAFDMVASHEEGERLATALLHLPAEYREVISLRFHEGFSLEEIARLTHAPLGTVKSRLYRGLDSLVPLLSKGTHP